MPGEIGCWNPQAELTLSHALSTGLEEICGSQLSKLRNSNYISYFVRKVPNNIIDVSIEFYCRVPRTIILR